MKAENGIPKILHLCWLSGEPFPEDIQKCLASWKEKLPDYSVMLWDLSKVDVNVCSWTKQAWEKKKYAFVSDYVRFYALYQYGGIYLDSDVEVFKSFDDLLDQDFFFCFEYTGIPEAAVIGARKGLPWLKSCLDWYLENDYLDQEERERQIVAPLILRNCFETTMQSKLLDIGSIQKLQGGSIFPYEYFSAKNLYTGQPLISENTYSMHHFKNAWLKKDFKVRTKRRIHILMIKVLAKNTYNKVMYKIQKLIHNPRIIIESNSASGN